MKNRHISEVELSAYLDDAAEDPLTIAQHLATCSACAHHYNALRDMSEALHAIPSPEIRPEFLTRVMAHVRDTEMEPARTPWLYWVYRVHKQKLGLIAAGGCLIAALAIIIWATPQQSSQNLRPNDVAVINSDGGMTAEYASAGRPQNEAMAEETLDQAPLSDEEIILALSNADWFETTGNVIESRMDTNAEFAEEYNVEAEDIVFDFLQEDSVS